VTARERLSSGAGSLDSLDWTALRVAPDRTHHLRAGAPAYAGRFDEVLGFHEPGLAAIRRGAKAWHIDLRGRAAYRRRFKRTFGFYEGRAAVTSPDGWHHVWPDGRDLYADRYDWSGNYQQERCTVRAPTGEYLHLDATGLPAYAGRWRYAGDFREGAAVVQREDGRSTHIDLHGRAVHGRWFLDLDPYHKGMAAARDDAGWMHVDAGGLPVYDCRFARVEPFYNGQARVECLNGGLQVIDEGGGTVIRLREGQATGERCAV